MATLGDYLVPLMDVLITYNSDGSITVTNNSSATLTGITLLAENNIESVKIGDYDLVSFGGSYGDKELVLPTIDPGNSVILKPSYGTKNYLTPTIASNDTGKNKINEITGYWDAPNKTLTMTAEGHNGSYSFTVTIPSLPNRVFTVQDATNNTTIGKYLASNTGAITFSGTLDSLRTFKITEYSYGNIDDFNSYTNVNQLQDVWRPYLCQIWLNTDSNFAYKDNSMGVEYQGNTQIQAHTADEPCLPSLIGRNWASGDFVLLAIYFYGTTTNSVLPMYITLKDGSGNEGTVIYGNNGEDQHDLRVAAWHEWDIKLESFSAAGVNLADINDVYLGFGSGSGSGTLYFDNIRLSPPICILSIRSADLARVDYAPAGSPCGDCTIDYQEFAIMASEWLMPPAPDANADLNSDGIVNFRDFCILANMWFKSQLWPQ
jgi:hypothetical protein